MLVRKAIVHKADDKQAVAPDTFCCIAGIYDLMSCLISFGLIRYWRWRAAQYLAAGTNEIWLDLGTGTADFAIALVQDSNAKARIIGIDIAPAMLARGRLKLQRQRLEDQIELRVGNAERIDLPDNSVDSCCSAFLVRNLVDIERGFREMLRVVRPGGRIICLEVSHPLGKILSALFHLYFYKCAPFFGIILGQKLNAYEYLPKSLKGFPDAHKLKEIMEKCGWSDVHFHRLNWGIVAIHVGTKR